MPDWACSGSFVSVTASPDELSVVCGEVQVPEGVECARGWRGLRIRGPFALTEIGVLSSVIGPLADAGISVFVISTFDTDTILVREELLARAHEILALRGHAVEPSREPCRWGRVDMARRRLGRDGLSQAEEKPA